MRIASLLPSATEIICALGARELLVGVSHECDFPAGVDALPALTRAKVDPNAPSATIDQAVRRLVSDGLSVYEIETERLAAAAPDVIVTQEQCEVCAVSYEEVVSATQEVLGQDVQVVSLKPNQLDDVLEDIARVAEAIGRVAEGADRLTSLRERIDKVRTRAAMARYKPRVACIEWLDPLMVAGNWIPEMVAFAGGRYEAVAPGEHSPAWTWEQLLEAQPEVIIVMPCGFDLDQTRSELKALTDQPRWHELQAVRDGRAYAVDGNAYLNRPGPRIVDSIELLGGLIQPGYFASLIPEGSYFRID